MYTNSYRELVFKTEDDESAFSFVAKYKTNNKYSCPNCNKETYPTVTQIRYLRCSECKSKSLILSGTKLSGLKISIIKILEFIWIYTERQSGVSITQAATELNISSPTIQKLTNTLRSTMAQLRFSNISSEYSLDMFSYNHQWVYVLKATDGSNNLQMVSTSDLSNISLVRDYVQQQHLVTRFDVVDLYCPVSIKRFQEKVRNNKEQDRLYNHEVYIENTFPKFGDQIAQSFKSWAESIYSGSLKDGYLQGYLDEYTYRNNRRKLSLGSSFHEVLLHLFKDL